MKRKAIRRLATTLKEQQRFPGTEDEQRVNRVVKLTEVNKRKVSGNAAKLAETCTTNRPAGGKRQRNQLLETKLELEAQKRQQHAGKWSYCEKPPT